MAADFPGALQNNADYPLIIKNNKIVVRVTDFRDPRTGAEFLGAYIPETTGSLDIARNVIENHASLIKQIGKGGVEIKAHGQEGEVSASDVVFTKRIYIYHDNDLSLTDRAALQTFAKSVGVTAILRGTEYLATMRWKGEKN